MSLTLLYGSSLSKKTDELYDGLIRDSLSHPENEYILLVPEQASLTAQEELIRRHPNHALFNVDVLTFNRLAFRVFNEMHEQPGKLIDDLGKILLLRLAAMRTGESLSVLKRNVRKPGFLSELKSVVSELSQYNVSAALLDEKLEKFPEYPVLQGKLRDISKIYTEFLNLLHEHYELSEERTARLSKCLYKWEQAPRTVVALDGFTGFTPPQYSVVEALIATAAEVRLTVTVGSGEEAGNHRTEGSLFYMGVHMAEIAKRIAERNGQNVTEQVIREEREVSPEIKHLERQLFRYPTKKFDAETDRIRIVRAADRKEEVRYVLSEIRESVRTGYEYREMAVVCGDPDCYAEEIDAQFGAAGIPYFQDGNRKLAENPLFLFVQDLAAVLEENFSFDSVFRLVKNPLMISYGEKALPDDGVLSVYERVAEAENYVLATGVRGRKQYGDRWQRSYRGFDLNRLPKINEVRAFLLGPVVSFSARFSEAGKTVEERTAEIVKLLENLSAFETMRKLSEAFEDPKDRLIAAVYGKSYEKLLELLDRLVEILGEEKLTVDEYREVLLAGVTETLIGIAPPTKDRLVIGDLKRTRLSHIKKLYIIGANEGSFPGMKSGSGLLTDHDRELLARENLTLSATQQEETFFVRYYLYLLFTNPSESVMMTYALMDNEGKGMIPSYTAGTLKALFPTVEVETAALSNPVNNGREVLEKLAGLWRHYREANREKVTEPDDLLREYYGWAVRETEYADELELIRRGLLHAHTAERLSVETAEKLYDRKIAGSVTRLENFASCPFKHFMQYGLKLRPRLEYGIDVRDIGTMFHDSISAFFTELDAKAIDFKALSEAERLDLVEESVRKVTGQYAILQDGAHNAYLVNRMRRIADRTVNALQRQWAAGEYGTIESEVPFDGAKDSPKLQIPLRDGVILSLNGRIDRIDRSEDGKSVYVKVIDYKSGARSLDYSQIYYGLQLQLLLYLKAATERERIAHPGADVVPAGIYYYHIDDPIVEANQEDTERAIYDELRMNGITNSDDGAVKKLDADFAAGTEKCRVVSGLQKKQDGSFFVSARVASTEELNGMCDFVLDKSKELAAEIMAGEMEAHPVRQGSDACAYCDFHNVCGFDPQIRGYSTKKIYEKELGDLVPGKAAHGKADAAESRETTDELWQDLPGRKEDAE